eukprot:1159888-Pelagomonas_calceolata.AAC.4
MRVHANTKKPRLSCAMPSLCTSCHTYLKCLSHCPSQGHLDHSIVPAIVPAKDTTTAKSVSASSAAQIKPCVAAQHSLR